MEYTDVHVHQDWPAIKGILEPLIVQYALDERKQLVVSRRRTIHDTYQKYFRSPVPNSKNPFRNPPPPSELTPYEPIKNMLNLPFGTGEFENQVESCVENFINRWPHLTVQELKSIYPSLHVPPNAVDVPSLQNLNIFVAASIFSCIPCTRAHRVYSAFSSWPYAMTHKSVCCEQPPGEGGLAISVEGHEAALALIEKLGLDPRNTFPYELDRLGLRLVCMNCEEISDAEKPMFGWRGIVHFFPFIRSLKSY